MGSRNSRAYDPSVEHGVLSFPLIVKESGQQFPSYTSTPNLLGDAISSSEVSREMIYYSCIN